MPTGKVGPAYKCIALHVKTLGLRTFRQTLMNFNGNERPEQVGHNV